MMLGFLLPALNVIKKNVTCFVINLTPNGDFVDSSEAADTNIIHV